MRHTPTQKNSQLVNAVMASLLIFGAVTYAIPIACEAMERSVPMPWIFTVLTLIAVVTAVFFLIRYRMTGFTYIVQPRNDVDADVSMETAYASEADVTRISPEWLDLVVMKSQGSRASVMEAVLSLGDLAAVIPIKRKAGGGCMTMKSVRDKYRERSANDFVFYDYTLTFLWEDAVELVFIDGQRYVGVVLEADDTMRRYFMQLKASRNADPES